MKLVLFLPFLLCPGIALGRTTSVPSSAPYELSIVHMNDIHSHFFETTEEGFPCFENKSEDGPCVGGIARQVTKIKEIRAKEKNVIVLASGDFYLSRSYYPFHGWRLASALMPFLTLDATSLGNHDFGQSMLDTAAYIISLNCPVVACNLVGRNGSFWEKYVNKSVILNIGGESIGVVGYISPETKHWGRIGKSLRIEDEIPHLQKEVEKLKKAGVNKIIAVGHSGYYVDKAIAELVPDIDVIVGGNSHILMQTDDDYNMLEDVDSPYPAVIEKQNRTDGESSKFTLVVHVPQHGKHVGHLKVLFDGEGVVTNYSGNPIFLSNDIKPDPETEAKLEQSRKAILGSKNWRHLPPFDEVLGFLPVELEGHHKLCRMMECSLGNMITDAILYGFLNSPSGQQHADAAVWNSGSIRSSIRPGNVTFQDLTYAVYLGDEALIHNMTGKELKNMLEKAVAKYDVTGISPPGSFLQVSRIKVQFDLQKPPGRRVVSLQLYCPDCELMYSPVNPDAEYRIAMPGFFLRGGDAFFRHHGVRLNPLDITDALAIAQYLRDGQHLVDGVGKIEDRITFLNNIIPKERFRRYKLTAMKQVLGSDLGPKTSISQASENTSTPNLSLTHNTVGHDTTDGNSTRPNLESDIGEFSRLATVVNDHLANSTISSLALTNISTNVETSTTNSLKRMGESEKAKSDMKNNDTVHRDHENEDLKSMKNSSDSISVTNITERNGMPSITPTVSKIFLNYDNTTLDPFLSFMFEDDEDEDEDVDVDDVHLDTRNEFLIAKRSVTENHNNKPNLHANSTLHTVSSRNGGTSLESMISLPTTNHHTTEMTERINKLAANLTDSFTSSKKELTNISQNLTNFDTSVISINLTSISSDNITSALLINDANITESAIEKHKTLKKDLSATESEKSRFPLMESPDGNLPLKSNASLNQAAIVNSTATMARVKNAFLVYNTNASTPSGKGAFLVYNSNVTTPSGKSELLVNNSTATPSGKSAFLTNNSTVKTPSGKNAFLAYNSTVTTPSVEGGFLLNSSAVTTPSEKNAFLVNNSTVTTPSGKSAFLINNSTVTAPSEGSGFLVNSSTVTTASEKSKFLVNNSAVTTPSGKSAFLVNNSTVTTASGKSAFLVNNSTVTNYGPKTVSPPKDLLQRKRKNIAALENSRTSPSEKHASIDVTVKSNIMEPTNTSSPTLEQSQTISPESASVNDSKSVEVADVRTAVENMTSKSTQNEVENNTLKNSEEVSIDANATLHDILQTTIAEKQPSMTTINDGDRLKSIDEAETRTEDKPLTKNSSEVSDNCTTASPKSTASVATDKMSIAQLSGLPKRVSREPEIRLHGARLKHHPSFWERILGFFHHH